MLDIIQSLWIGSSLSRMEQASIQSFLDQGHVYHLYTYQPMEGIPPGTTVKDANEIIPLRHLHYKDFPKLSNFADFFRFALLYKRGNWWVDTDAICLQPFNFQYPFEYMVIGTEDKPDGGTQPVAGFMKMPAGSSLMLAAWEKCQSLDISKLTHCSSGMEVLADIVKEFDYAERYLLPPVTFCPVPWWQVERLLDPTPLTFSKQTFAVHLWNEMFTLRNLDKSQAVFPLPYIDVAANRLQMRPAYI